MDGLDVSAPPRLHVSLAEALRSQNDHGRLTALMLSHGSLELRWFAPKETDQQVPHDRDELYIVVFGSGTFVRAVDAAPFDDVGLPLSGTQRAAFGPGDALFVPAGAEHRFEDFTPDFAAWVMFYGPEGGEHAHGDHET